MHLFCANVLKPELYSSGNYCWFLLKYVYRTKKKYVAEPRKIYFFILHKG